MGELIFGISGVRGIVGETLTEGVAESLGVAFGTFIKDVECRGEVSSPPQAPTIAVGKDLRQSGELIKKAFIKGVIKEGINIIDLGDCATPTLLFNVQKVKADGGAVITASHNPEEWNGVKFVNREGTFLDANEVEALQKIYKRVQSASGGLKVQGKNIKDNRGIERHKKAVLDAVDFNAIRKKHFKVVFDSANGVLGKEGKEFLEELGCDVVEENSDRGLEPIKENLFRLAKRVKEEREARLGEARLGEVHLGADIGFAVDPDGDRLSLVTELGTALGEEYTLPLVSAFVLGSRKGVVVTNLSTSRMVEDVALQNGCSVVRTKVGEVNVVKEMKRLKAIFGGEGNGGIIDPLVQYTRDALVGMGRILEYMAVAGEKISSLANRIPKYYMRKEKVQGAGSRVQGSKVQDFDFLVNLFPGGRVNYEDGVRVDFKGGWIHLRESNTEPILRIIVEAKDKNLVDSLIEEVKGKMRESSA